jgi:hypothetical protein
MGREKQVIIAVSCIFFLLAGCQQQTKIAGEPAAKAESKEIGPRIMFENTVYDFGKVGPRQKLNGEFKFKNTGDEPLIITNVQKCCGAVVNLDKEELAPGESGVLKVQYTSSSMPNNIIKRLYVSSNDKNTPKATLTIKAQTVLKVDYEPKQIKLMLKEENADCPPITIESVDGKPFSITSFKATNDALTANFDSSVKAAKFVLEPKADIEKLQKRSTGVINIGLAFSGPDQETETIRIIFQALSRFSLRPSMLIVLYDNPAEPVKRTLWVINNYGEDFDIESTVSKGGIIKVLSQKKVGNRYQLELEITPPAGEDNKRFIDTFKINLKDGETLEVPCRGIYRAPKPEEKAVQ